MQDFWGGLLFLIYMVLGYFAVPHTIWEGKVFWGTPEAIWNRRVFLALCLGWLIIPWWFLKRRKG